MSMPRYRVDYYIGDKVFRSTYINAWSRRDAYFDTIPTDLYKEVITESRRTNKKWTWDATKLGDDNV